MPEKPPKITIEYDTSIVNPNIIREVPPKYAANHARKAKKRRNWLKARAKWEANYID